MELLDLDELPCLHPTPTVWCPLLYCNPEDARTGAATWSPGRCPPSTSQSHVHIRARHEPCSRRAGEDDEHLGVAGLHQTSLCCSCFGLTGQDELQPAGLLACLLPSLPCAYAFIALQERTEHICCTCSFLYLYDVAKTSGWIVFWAAGSRSE